MDFKLIPPYLDIDKYNNQEVYKIPVRIKRIFIEKSNGPIVPIILERLDFKTGKIKMTAGITFKKSVDLFNDLDKKVPFITDAMIYKNNGKIAFKVVGVYNTGFWEKFNDVEGIMNNDEKSINEIYHHNYKKLNEWIGDLDDSFYDKPE